MRKTTKTVDSFSFSCFLVFNFLVFQWSGTRIVFSQYMKPLVQKVKMDIEHFKSFLLVCNFIACLSYAQTRGCSL